MDAAASVAETRHGSFGTYAAFSLFGCNDTLNDTGRMATFGIFSAWLDTLGNADRGVEGAF